MRTAVLNETGAETTFGNFTNVSGSEMKKGYPVAICTTAASVDGNKAVLPAAANLLTFAGIATSDVADNGIGEYVADGYVASAYIFATGTSVTNAAGVTLGPNAGSLGVNSTGLQDKFGPIISLAAIGAAINSPGGHANHVLVRAM